MQKSATLTSTITVEDLFALSPYSDAVLRRLFCDRDRTALHAVSRAVMSGRKPPGYMRLHGQQHQYPALSRTELTEERETERERERSTVGWAEVVYDNGERTPLLVCGSSPVQQLPII